MRQVPAAYARWGDLLRALGMVDAPAPHHLLRLLASVAAAAGGAPLNANERRAALRLLATLCDGDADAALVRLSGLQSSNEALTDRLNCLPLQMTCYANSISRPLKGSHLLLYNNFKCLRLSKCLRRVDPRVVTMLHDCAAENCTEAR